MGVIVVEAGEKSGALITSSHALDQGREVFAVPGPIDEPQSVGSNRLIKAGAKLVQSVGDVMDELWASMDGPARIRGASVPETEIQNVAASPAGMVGGALGDRLLSLLTLTPASADELAEDSGASVAEVLSTLLELELSGLACSCPGGRFMAGDRRPTRT
jgi:DNA processing protein